MKPPTNWILLCLSRTRHKKIPGIPTTGFQVFFLEMEEDFIEVLKKGITFSLGGVVRKVM